jgi:hypothetical protein
MPRLRVFVLLGLLALLVVAAMLSAAPAARAQSGGGYDLTWNTVDGGGGQSTGGGYTLTGTIGQPDAGTLSASGYSLAGGFWAALSEVVNKLFLPLLQR